MLAKRTSKNQITLPKAIANHFPGVEYFDIRQEDDQIVLTPIRAGAAEKVRQKLEQLGITERDVKEAVDWSRHSQ